MLNSFEDNLKIALERQQPSADFTAQVMARVARRHSWRMGWAAAAAALFMVGAGLYGEGQMAKRKLLLAMRITGTKMQEVRQRVVASTGVEQ